MIGNVFKSVARIGVKDPNDRQEMQAIVLSNYIVIILFFIASFLVVVNLLNGTYLRAITSALVIPILAFALLLNKLEQNNLMRMTICVLPIAFIIGMALVFGGKVSGNSKGYYIFILGLSQLPFILFKGKQEHRFLYACMVFNICSLFSFNVLIQFLHDYPYGSGEFWADKAREMLGFVMVSAVVWFKTKLNERYMDDVTELNESLKVRNEEVKQLVIELQQQNEVLDDQYKLLENKNEELAKSQVNLTELNRRIENNTEALIELTMSEVVSLGDFEAALRIITEKAAEVLDASRVGIWSMDMDGESIVCLNLYQRNTKTHSAGGRLYSRTYPKYFSALKMKKTIVATDAPTDYYTSEYAKDYLLPLEIKSMMDTPYFIKGNLAGVVCCEQQKVQRNWTSEDIFFAQALADLVTLAYESQERKQAQDNISKMNAELEQKIEIRTAELMARNVKLEEYSFYVSHVLRSPLSSMMGMLRLLKLDNTQVADPEFFEKLDGSIQKVDDVVKELNNKLN